MNDVTELHHQAMDLVDRAMEEQRAGNRDEATKLFGQASEIELAAIDALDEKIEPSFSVLHRSAASMAMSANRFSQAELILTKALSHDPHPEIADEMRELLEQIYFGWNLERNNLALADESVELSLAGPLVGFGIVSQKELFDRIRDASKLIIRTAERKMNVVFRESGQVRRDIWERFQPWISTPRAGSFGISLRFGISPEQFSFEGMSNTSDVIEEFMDLMLALNEGRLPDLQERIPETEYFNNFLGLGKRLAPDGKKVRRVGFSSATSGIRRTIVVTRPSVEIPAPPSRVPSAELVEVHGRLLFADAIGSGRRRGRRRTDGNTIKVVEEDGKRTHTVRVPIGMMDDIVRPLWDLPVAVVGNQVGKAIELHSISELVQSPA